MMNLLLSIKLYFTSKIYNPLSAGFYNILLKTKIRKLIKRKKTEELTKIQKRHVREFYRQYGINRVDTDWHRFYGSSTGVFSTDYVPENLFYIYLEPLLNDYTYIPALADKNLLDRLFNDIKQPETIVKNMNGFIYENGNLISLNRAVNLCDNAGALFIKPTVDTGGGKNIHSFTCKNGVTNIDDFTTKKLFGSYGKNYIVQKKLIQHELMAALNRSSLNTFRVMTYLKGDFVKILSTIVRMGREGSITDNSTTGGISCGVGKDGKLNEVGYQLSGDSFTETDSGIKFADITLPFTDKIMATVTRLHSSAPFFRIISWDLAMDNVGDSVLIEYNIHGQDITFHQLNNGPVLADLLDELK